MIKMKKVKFNIIDFLIVLAVICAAFLCVTVLGNLKGISTGGGANQVKMRYSVEFTLRDKPILDEFLAAKERGDICYVSEKEKVPAKLVDVTYTPARKHTLDLETGELFFTDIPEKYDITVVLESDGTETENDLLAGGAAVIKVGDETSVKGKGYAGYGFVVSLDIVE